MNLFYLIRTYFTSPRRFFKSEKYLARGVLLPLTAGDFAFTAADSNGGTNPPSQHVSGGPEMSSLHHMV